ncbi:MAG: transcriptional regulator [Pseudonocardiaceae bacterium]|nr:transcriptional regulator [Pseudonocardiaceae bacterium]
METIDGWTGRTACALQAALLMSNESFAQHLKVATRTVASWHEEPDKRPNSKTQQILDRKYEQASPAAKKRFAAKVSPSADAEADGAVADAEQRLSADPNIGAALEWLDQHAGWEPGTARQRVASRLARLNVHELQDRGSRRGRVNQRHIAHALAGYYRDRVESHGRYCASYGPDREVVTSVLTHPDWLDLECPLIASHDRLAVADIAADEHVSLDDEAAERAAQRLAETLATGVRLVDMPLYQLMGIEIRRGEIAGSVGVGHFVAYALTMDLLEGELVDALAADVPIRHGELPLRDWHLPDIASALNVSGRVCAGGALALCAIARPASPERGEADYVLLVQERSSQVVNAARRLAVIPKGFHQPLTDLGAGAQIGSTLRREMEEELFGRNDLDNTVTDQRRADPMHPSRLSEPMRSLMDNPDRLRMECTGFGLNLVSGNFEFASLIVIDDENFWSRYGGEIGANWEAIGLRQYSSLDRPLLAELIADVAWSNEGLFALLQGLRRLEQIGGDRVNLPAIEWDVRQ